MPGGYIGILFLDDIQNIYNIDLGANTCMCYLERCLMNGQEANDKN
jgi:hypothetical protein